LKRVSKVELAWTTKPKTSKTKHPHQNTNKKPQAKKNDRHMFSDWEISHEQMPSRVLFQQPAHYVPEATLQH
jgi:hypothetical protein